MAFADTSTYTLAYAKESTFDEPVAGTGVYKLLRNTGESLNTSLESARSDEIDSSRQYTGSVHVSGTSAGSVNFQLSYAEYDDFFEAVLQSADWSAGYSDTGTNITSNVVTVTSTAGLKVGKLVRLSGLAATAEDDVYTVHAVSDPTHFETAETLTDEAVASVTITNSGTIENGSTQRSYTFEKNFQVDGVNNYFNMSGMRAGSMSLSLASGSILSGEIGLQGATGVGTGTTSQDAGTYIATTTNELMNSVSDVTGLTMYSVTTAGVLALMSGTFQELSINLNNNLRDQTAVGSLFPAGIGSGRIDVEATASLYFASQAFFNQFLANGSIQIRCKISDPAGNTYGIVLPEMKIASHEVTASGADADVMASVTFSGVKDTRSGTAASIIMTRIAA